MAIVLFILIIAVLILIHEVGHFITARAFGVKVEEFGIGFPPRIFSVKKGDTLYSLNLLPLGGFVKLFGEDGKNEKSKDSYSAKPWWQKLLIGMAGVTANFFLGVLLLGIGFSIGMPRVATDYSDAVGVKILENKVIIAQVDDKSIAQNVGLKSGDVIISINDKEVDSVQTLKKQFADYENQQVQIEVERNQESLDLVVDLPSKAKKIGVILSENQVYKFGFLKALWIGLLEGAKLFGYTVIAFGTLIKNLIFTGQVSEFVTGPVGIYYITSSASKLGAVYVLQLVSLISINLAVVNLLPIPALDGGRIVFNILEGIRGKSIGSQLENTIHAVGYIFLILLVGLVFYRDIVRIPYYQNLFN